MRSSVPVGVGTNGGLLRTWLSKDWSSDGSLRTVYDIEERSGDQLRSEQYKVSFFDDASADVLAEQLIEGQTPVSTTGALLRQWYQRYHPGAFPRRITSAAELEAFMGDDLRSKYQGIDREKLVTVSSHKVVRTWQEQYDTPVLKSISRKPPPLLGLRRIGCCPRVVLPFLRSPFVWAI